MAAPAILLDEYCRVRLPAETLGRSKVYVFAEPDGSNPRAVIFIAQNGKAIVHSSAPLAEFRRSRRSRTEPHVLVTSSGEEWLCTREGCGCGSPLKQLSWRDGYKVFEGVPS